MQWTSTLHMPQLSALQVRRTGTKSAGGCTEYEDMQTAGDVRWQGAIKVPEWESGQFKENAFYCYME